MRRTKWNEGCKKWKKILLVHMRRMRNYKNKIYQNQGKLIQPPHGGGRIRGSAASTGADLFLQH